MRAKQVIKEKKDIKHEKDHHEYVLRLFITGATPNSTRAVENLKQICEDHIKGKYSLEIIDVYQQQEMAQAEQLVEMVEIPAHRWFIGCQFHPEFTSTPRDGHPLFKSFIEAALQNQADRAKSAAAV